MPLQETVDHIQRVFEQEEERNGQTNHRDVALALVGKHSPLHNEVAREVLRMPTAPYVYEGAKETLRQLLDNSQDRVYIWTQGNVEGQVWKVATSRLGLLRRTVGKERFQIYASEDKIAGLPQFLDRLAQEGFERVVIIDDKSSNIQKVDSVTQRFSQTNPSVQILPVWINQGRTKDKIPKGYTSVSHFAQTHTVIEDIREMASFSQDGVKTAYLVDYDHTLVETSRAKQHMFTNIAQVVEATPATFSHPVDMEAGILGAEQIEPLQHGMSGNKVVRARFANGETRVVKHDPNSPKMQAEMRGLEILSQTPLAPFLPKIHTYSKERRFIAMEDIDGLSVRELLKAGEHLPSLPTIYNRLLDVELFWWRDQIRNPQTHTEVPAISMQRQEWNDTYTAILSEALPAIATHFTIPPDRLYTSPLVIAGKTYPSLAHVVESIQAFLSHTPVQTVLEHGDITGANIIPQGTRGGFKIIDGEWTGLHDPAEAFVRMAKHLSTTTAKSIHAKMTPDTSGTIYIALNADFSKDALDLQNHILSRMKTFQHELRNPRFSKDVFMYFAGSYLRELALAQRRNVSPEQAVFALVKAVEMITLAESL